MERRDFLERLLGPMIAMVGGIPLASHGAESRGWAAANQSEGEEAGAGVVGGPIKYPAPGATLEGYLAKPRSAGPHPTVLLVHANNGLEDHIRDVARRYAEAGFVALAVDQLSRQGGTASFASLDTVRKNIEALSGAEVIADLDAAFVYLQSNPSVRQDRIGVTGFAWGGRMAFLYAASNPRLKAAVVFYGAAPPEERLAEINCPVLAHYGKNDLRMSSEVSEITALMKQYGKSYHPKIHPAAGEAFFNDTNPAYNGASAQDAWERTIAFFAKNLG